MAALNDILGMNGRNINYLRLNKKYGREVADSKLLTKRLLEEKNVPHPRLLGLLESKTEVESFDWLQLKGGFVLKPSDGWGGSGIMVVRKPGIYAGEWLLMDGRKVTVEDLKLHALDIVEGSYSRNRTPDRVLIEERVKIHPKFNKYAFGGTPDVRVIVFKKIPVMAMLRLPTRESEGKANLHQGAVGLGVDLATGITTYGVHYDSVISRIPETNKKVNGLIVPFWSEILKVAVDAQRATKLGYVGVDLVIDEDKGPLVLELNDQPGLQIQLANRTGLLGRLKRVDNLEVKSKYKGIQIAQVLFAEDFSDKVKIEQGRRIIGIFERVKIKDDKGKLHTVIAKMDTGAFNASIDRGLAEELGLLRTENILFETDVESSLGKEVRPVIETEMVLAGRKIVALTHVANRKHLRAPMLVGRQYLKSFLVDPSKVKNY
jgi:alpha-L-glutamate ligase-like protein